MNTPLKTISPQQHAPVPADQMSSDKQPFEHWLYPDVLVLIFQYVPARQACQMLRTSKGLAAALERALMRRTELREGDVGYSLLPSGFKHRVARMRVAFKELAKRTPNVTVLPWRLTAWPDLWCAFTTLQCLRNEDGYSKSPVQISTNELLRFDLQETKPFAMQALEYKWAYIWAFTGPVMHKMRDFSEKCSSVKYLHLRLWDNATTAHALECGALVGFRSVEALCVTARNGTSHGVQLKQALPNVKKLKLCRSAYLETPESYTCIWLREQSARFRACCLQAASPFMQTLQELHIAVAIYAKDGTSFPEACTLFEDVAFPKLRVLQLHVRHFDRCHLVLSLAPRGFPSLSTLILCYETGTGTALKGDHRGCRDKARCLCAGAAALEQQWAVARPACDVRVVFCDSARARKLADDFERPYLP